MGASLINGAGNPMVLEPHDNPTTGFKGRCVGRMQGCPESLIMQPAVGRHRHTVHIREVGGSSPSVPIVGLKVHAVGQS